MALTLPAGSSRAIYGDQNTQAATVVPSLLQAADGRSLTVEADAAALNNNQVLTLNDFVYENTMFEAYPQVVSPGNMAIIFTTPNWVRTDEMYLELEVIYNQTGPQNPLAPDTRGTEPMAQDQSLWNQPEFALLQPLVRVDLAMGNNNQIIGRNMMAYKMHMRMIAQDRKSTEQHSDILGNIGMPNSIGGYNSSNGAAGAQQLNTRTDYLYNDVNLAPIPLRKRWEAIVKDIIYSAGFNGATGTTIKNRFAFPLGMINSFFKNDQFLPPALPFRIDMEYLTSAQEFISTGFNNAKTGVLTDRAAYSMTLTGNGRVVCKGYQLKAQNQLNINTAWLTKPFLYNYETYEYYAMTFDGTTVNITADLAISQQRPTELILKVMNDNAAINFVQTTTANDNTTDNQTNYVPYQYLGVYPYAACPGILMTEPKFLISGRLNYDMRTINPAAMKYMAYQKDGSDMTNNGINEHTYQELDERDIVISNQSSATNGFFYKISLNPGDMQKHGLLSTDQGAVSIRMICVITDIAGNPLPSTFKLFIYKKLPEQLRVDTGKNIEIISWPAVATNSGNSIAATYNMN
jgi:hypothetical protein